MVRTDESSYLKQIQIMSYIIQQTVDLLVRVALDVHNFKVAKSCLYLWLSDDLDPFVSHTLFPVLC